jgi:MFS family permease
MPLEHVPWRVQGSIYGTAFFFGPLQTIATMAAALFVAGLVSVELPFLIAFILASRQVLTVSLSVYGGALMDSFGSRRVIIAFGLLGAASAMAYPLVPGAFGVAWGGDNAGDPALWFIVALVSVQMISGYAEGNCWIGTQALVSQALGGHPVYAGRMIFVARLGGILGPLLMGPAWDLWGSWGGFLVLALWIACGTVAAIFLPRLDGAMSAPPNKATEDGTAGPDATKAAKTAAPKARGAGFGQTLRLLLIPAVALVIMLTVLRQAGSGLHSSFYVVWLDKEIGLSGTLIGGLLASANVASAVTALSTGFFVRHVSAHWLLIVTIGMAIIGTAIVPALGNIYVLLIMAICIRGTGQGVNLPIMLTILAKNVPMGLQGRIMALRVAFNRGGGALVPLAAGAIAEVVGIGNSFYVIGGIGGIMLILLSVWVARSPAFGPDS